jgi:type VI secretion system protein ImpH
MASTDRRSTRDLIAEIGKDGPRFRFFQVIRLLALSSKGGDGSAVPTGLRFGTPLTLAFQASEISEVEPRPPLPHALPSGEDDAEEAEADRLALLVTVGFMGMTGPSGVLPNAYTELLMERKNFFRDTSAHAFLDLFSHRAISLFYQSWRKHRFYLAYEAGDRDSFSRNLLDIVGMGLAPLQSRLEKQGGVPDNRADFVRVNADHSAVTEFDDLIQRTVARLEHGCQRPMTSGRRAITERRKKSSRKIRRFQS